MFIKRKSTNLFKKSVTLSLMKLKNAANAAVKVNTEEKPTISQKKGKKSNTSTANNTAIE